MKITIIELAIGIEDLTLRFSVKLDLRAIAVFMVVLAGYLLLTR